MLKSTPKVSSFLCERGFMEENFIELLEAYLDEEEIKSKKNSDISMGEGYNELCGRNSSPFSVENAISIHEFITHYLGMKGDYQKLLHCGLKELNCPYVVGVDNRFANRNPELIYRGYLLIVLDYKKRRGTYINPIYLKEILENQNEKDLKIFLRKQLHELSELENYFKTYNCLLERVENSRQFLELLIKLHKEKQLDEIKRLESKLGRKLE